MTSSLGKSKQIIGAHFQTFFLQYSYVLVFLNIHMLFIILKTYDQQFTLTTKKSMHIIFKTTTQKHTGHIRSIFIVSWLWSPYGIGQTIIFSCCGFFLSIFFYRFSSPNLSGHTYFHTWYGLSANLQCMSEMCGMRVAENAGPKKVAKNHHLGTIAQICRTISSQPRSVSTIGKKHVKQQYVLKISPQYGEHRPTNG